MVVFTLSKLAKAAMVFAAVAGGGGSVLAQPEGQEPEELTRDEVIDRISRVEAAIAEHKAKGEDEHVEGATSVLEQLQAALADFDEQGGAQAGTAEDDVFSILDQDQDGRISRDEFLQGFEEEPEGLWEAEDKDGDGFISFEEFGGPKGLGTEGGGGGGGGGGEAVDPSEVFYMMDTDGDNRISKDEFNAHFENIGVEPNEPLFKRDDKNANGFIEFEEFGGNQQGGANNLFAQLDTDGDRRLSREEFTVEWHTAPIELFDNDDADGDGFVSFDEFGGPKGLEQPRQGQGQGQGQGRRPPQRRGGGGGRQRNDEGGAEGGGQQQQNMFAMLDADQDGRISSEEFNVEWHSAPEGLWEQEDRDGDGFISYDEFSGPKGQGAPGGDAEGGEEEEDIFSVLDQDQDGRISREEFVAGFDGAENEPEGLWDAEDANGDGFIAWEEFGGPKGAGPDGTRQQQREL